MRAFFIMRPRLTSPNVFFKLSKLLLIVSLPVWLVACSATDTTVTTMTEDGVQIRSGLVTEVVPIETAETVADFITAVDFQVGADDLVFVDGVQLAAVALDTPLAETPAVIEIKRAKTITVAYGADVLTLSTAAETVADVIAQSGIAISDQDTIFPDRAVQLAPGMKIEVQPADRVTVFVDGEELSVSTSQTRVGAILAEANIHLTAMDYAIPHVTELAGDTIEIVRVTESVVTESDPISFETLSQPDPELALDTTNITQAGQLGWRTRQIKVRTENGAEVARELTGEWITQQPIPQIIGYGTNVVVQTEVTPDGPIEYWRKINMYATSYSPSRAGTPVDAPWYGITRSGEKLVKGLVAVDPSVIPLGTLLYIEGYGFAKASDTGGGIKGKWVDLGYEDHDWVSWRAYVDVYILTPVPPADQIVWIIR